MIYNSEIPYFAGLFDGEGSINIVAATPGRRSWCVSCSIKMANSMDLMIDLQRIFGGNIGEKRTYRDNGDRPQYYWQARSQLAINFLEKVYPWLKVKKAEADVAFRFAKTIGAQRVGHRLTQEQKEERVALKVELQALR